MCSVGDGDIDEQENAKFMVPRNGIKILNKSCNKCKTKESCIVSQHKYGYCKECFLASTTHKFRSYLGSLKLSYVDDNILIVHKCGHQTTALLHLLRSGLDVAQYKKIKIKPIVLFIEDLYHLTVSQRQDIMKQVSDEVKNFNFELYFTSLSEYMSLKEVRLARQLEDIMLDENDESVINEVLKKCPNKTVKMEVRNLYWKKLVTEIGKMLNCKWALTTQVAINNAADILTNVCLGRGPNALTSSRINVPTKQDTDNIIFLAPFIDMDIKELALYNYFNNLSPITYTIKTENSYQSVQNLLRKFVEDLQVSYPSTVTTIVKTGEKLTINNKTNTLLCSFCKSPKEYDNEELSSKESTKYSHWISTVGGTNDEYANHREVEGNNYYCYRCGEIMKFIL